MREHVHLPKTKPFFLVVLIVLLFQGVLFGQENQKSKKEKETLEKDSIANAERMLNLGASPALPLDYNINASTPTTAALGQYGDLPVSLSSGVINISIPIHQISVPGLTIPISLDYHASGIKVDQVATQVGLGWVLNAGGMLSQSTTGKDDLGSWALPTSSFFAPNTPTTYNEAYPGGSVTDYEWLKNVLDNCEDTEPDSWSYNFIGRSGQFMEGDEGFISYPLDYFEIGGGVGLITLTDNQGIRYEFGEEDYGFITNCSPSLEGCGWESTSRGYYLTKVITPMKDTVYFEYEGESLNYAHSWYEARYRLTGGTSGCSISSLPSDTQCVNANQGSALRLKKVTSSRGDVVEFTYSTTNRLDLPGSKRLESISVKNELNEVIRSFSLTHSFTQATRASGLATTALAADVEYRLMLDAVTEAGKPPYEFEYMSGLPHRLNMAQDFYGYFNGGSSMSTLIPSTSTPVTYSGANRAPNGSHIAKGSLTKMTYPTGGSSTFTYELAQMGMRIKQVKHYAATGQLSSTKVYEYEGFVSNGGYSSSSFHQLKMQRQDDLELGKMALECNYAILSSYPAAFEAKLPLYAKYTKVIEYIDETGDMGKIEHYFTSPSDIANTPSFSGGLYDKSYMAGLPKGTKEYRKEGSLYRLKRETEHKYKIYTSNPNTSNTGLITDSRKVLKATFTEPEILEDPFNGIPFFPARFQFVFYHLYSGYLGKEQTIIKTYAQDDHTKWRTDTVQTVHEPYYNVVLSETSSQSVGSPQIRRTYYPFQFTATGTTHAPAYPIRETIESSAGSLLEGRIQLYKTVSGRQQLDAVRLWESSTLQSSAYSSSNPATGSYWQTKLDATSYDTNGNLVYFELEGGKKVARIYDYAAQLMVAEVSGASLSGIAYSSFETDSKGGWTYPTANVSTAQQKTGKRAYKGSTSSVISKSVPSGSYVVSFYARTASGSTTIMGQSVNTTWQLYHLPLTGSSISISVPASVFIDELRLHPQGASMQSYTYKPLVGITSAAGADARVEVYEYDNYGRLEKIRDYLGRLRKQASYGFQVSN